MKVQKDFKLRSGRTVCDYFKSDWRTWMRVEYFETDECRTLKRNGSDGVFLRRSVF